MSTYVLQVFGSCSSRSWVSKIYDEEPHQLLSASWRTARGKITECGVLN
jgi:hypothetical protein